MGKKPYMYIWHGSKSKTVSGNQGNYWAGRGENREDGGYWEENSHHMIYTCMETFKTASACGLQ